MLFFKFSSRKTNPGKIQNISTNHVSNDHSKRVKKQKKKRELKRLPYKTKVEKKMDITVSAHQRTCFSDVFSTFCLS